jgi:exopolyphosphatase/guanosine-5'-triphosphate,3'-diphosphate pyrophosphatase
MPDQKRRSAVVDLGSNSVRLVVYESEGRNAVAIFNEKATLRLGRGLQSTGRLNPEGVSLALDVMARYHAIARAMRADPFEVLATAAVRDASNGPEFTARLERLMPGVPIRILTGDEEAAYSTAGLLAGLPDADGTLADIGGGSLELVRLEQGRHSHAVSLSLGALRLADRAGNDVLAARTIVEADLATIPWLASGAGRDLFLVGGAFRGLARLHMAQTAYPLHIVHHYTLAREEARNFAGSVPSLPKRSIERVPGLRRRADDLPYAAIVLRRLLRATAPRRVVFSAHGLREGWFLHRVARTGPEADPIMTEQRELGLLLGRDPGLPPALIAWTALLFAGETAEERHTREAACWLADTGSHDHPEYRAEQSFNRILRQPGGALDHRMRAFLATAVALRYDAEPEAPFLETARALLDASTLQRALQLGLALRLATMLGAGTPDLLAGATLKQDTQKLTLTLHRGHGLIAGDSVYRRLERLAASLGLQASMDVALDE